MDLPDIIEALEEKGFTRQAVLLKSSSNREYVEALTHPQWEEVVREAFGDEIYDGLYISRSASSKLLDAIFGLPRFEAREYETDPLQVHLERSFGLHSLQRASEVFPIIADLENQARRVIYSEVKSVTEDNLDLLFEIYKD